MNSEQKLRIFFSFILFYLTCFFDKKVKVDFVNSPYDRHSTLNSSIVNQFTSNFETNISRLIFSHGDRIACRTSQDDLKYHYLMAIDKNSFIHLASHQLKNQDSLEIISLNDFVVKTNKHLCLNHGPNGIMKMLTEQ